MEENGVKEVIRLRVKDLEYYPRRKFVAESLSLIRRKISDYKLEWILPGNLKYLKEIPEASLLNIAFDALSGQITAILGTESERKSLIHLLAGRKKSGKYDGDASLCGDYYNQDYYYYENVAFVPEKSLYIPGLTYVEQLTYGARLRMNANGRSATMKDVRERVDQLLDMMDLRACKDRVIPEYPALRGEEGGDMRRLSIAMEISGFPDLVLIDEPVLGFDPAIAMHIMSCINNYAEMGKIVCCSMSKPVIQMIPLIGKLVLLSYGHTIYAGAPANIEEHFCTNMGYRLKKGVDLFEFVLDIASGVERPVEQRTIELPSIMKDKFEQSAFFHQIDRSERFCSAFDAKHFRWYGYKQIENISTTFSRTMTVVERAILAKIKDFQTTKASFGIAIIVGLLVGYLQYGQGDYGRYATNLLGIPYANTTNCGALLFFSGSYMYLSHAVNCHIICEKLRLFKYEQSAGCCSLPAFVISVMLSDGPFVVAIAALFSNIIYWMTSLNFGLDNYSFYVGAIIMLTLEGLSAIYLFAVILRREFVIRESYLAVFTLLILMSGYAFQLSTMTYYIGDASVVNPIRWTFEGLMAWKFQSYEDGYKFLTPYQFQRFDHEHLFGIMLNFILITNSVTILFLLPGPIILRKSSAIDAERDSKMRDSMASFDSATLPEPTTRPSELVAPLLFARESSVTGRKSNLSINHSTTGFEHENRGPTVMFKDVTYRVRDRKSPVGYKTILNRVSGQFDWGKLSMILGAAESGKSSLLHFLAGDTGASSEIIGSLFFNKNKVDPKVPLWQRCSLVEAKDEHFRDLTVKDVITFSMRLRCTAIIAENLIEENVTKTVALLHLETLVNRKTKSLTPGELRRLSIAEEMVHGPNLLLIDEPTTGLSGSDESVLMTTFREMVNADRTVVATMFQPSAAVFQLFDTLHLLNKGHVVYHGPISNAVQFFVNSPFSFDFLSYGSATDYLLDISGGAIKDSKGDNVDVGQLVAYYHSTESYGRLRSRFREINAAMNPLRKSADEANATGDRMVSVEIDESEEDILKNIKTPLPASVRYIIACVKAMLGCETPSTIDLKLWAMKARVILYRSFLSLFYRYELILATCFVSAMLAVILGWIMGDSSGITSTYNVLALNALGIMLILFGSVQYIFYLNSVQQVFMKEHARGLYSNFLNWLLSSTPLYILRFCNAVIYSTIVYGMINLDTVAEQYGFFISITSLTVLSSFMSLEMIMAAVNDRRTAYKVYPGLVGIQFIFSGLFVKIQSLPGWLHAWTPYISVLRYNLEGNFYNTYGPLKDSFPVLPLNGYSVYQAFIDLFSWGGGTKSYCLQAVIINVFFFKALTLLVSGISCVAQQGGRKFRKNIDYNE